MANSVHKVLEKDELGFIPVIHLGEYYEDLILNTSAKFCLVSYAYVRTMKPEKIKQSLEVLNNGGVNVVLDCGAYTAWKQGAEIDIDEYAKFVTEYKDYFIYAFALDVIGNENGTHKNWCYLRDNYPDLVLMPVWHSNGSTKTLKKYIDDNPPLIGLGGLVGMGRGGQFSFLNSALTYTMDAKIKTHALGVGDESVLTKLPVNFADSTSWLLSGKMGCMWSPFEGYTSISVSHVSWLKDKEKSDKLDRYFADPKRSEYTFKLLNDLSITIYDLYNNPTLVALYNLEALLRHLKKYRKPVVRRRRLLF